MARAGIRGERANGNGGGAERTEHKQQQQWPEQWPAKKQHEESWKKDGGRDWQGRRNPVSPQNVATPARGGRFRDAGSGNGGGGGGERSRGSSSALEDLMRRKGVEEAWVALEQMQQQGASTDKYTISRMLMKTVGDGRSKFNPSAVYRGIALVEKFIEMQPKDVDEVLFNALLDTCCRLKDLNRLESTVQRMRELKVSPSPVTLGILVKTYGQAGDLQKVLQVWGEMETQRGQANAVTYGCMIDACVKCGNLEKAVEIFMGMREAGTHRNTILYTTLIKGYGLEKDLKSALELFREMPVEGVPYNTITYNSIIDACIKGNDLPTAEGLLREMTLPGSSLQPDLITFSTLLKGYCHIGDLDKALQVSEAIKARGLRCDELVYNTLMDGCVKASDITAGVGLFEEMIHAGMRPSAITHSILARLYQHAGYEHDASEAVAQLYQHHGIERPTGGGRGKYNPRSPNGGGANNRNGWERRDSSASNGWERRDSSASTASYGGWGEMAQMSGFDGYGSHQCSPYASAPSTPAGSPHASHMQHRPGGPYLPSGSMVPPLPGLGGQCPQGAPNMSPWPFTPAGDMQQQQQQFHLPMPISPPAQNDQNLTYYAPPAQNAYFEGWMPMSEGQQQLFGSGFPC